MKKCVLDGSRLADAAAIYRQLGQAFHFPDYFGNNPDALWDALGEYSGEPVAVIWRNAARSQELLGPHFAAIVAVLQKGAADGALTLELA
jgi:RNAse (barnase) inhibitor barstar